MFAAPAEAQDAASRSLTWPRPTAYAEVAVSDKYIYRGYIVEDHGPVVQPYVEVFGEIYSSENGWLQSASLRLAVFNSFQPNGAEGRADSELMRAWYETQIEAGMAFILAKGLSVTASYLRFDSPNGAYGGSNAFTLALQLDDEWLLGACALNPRALWTAPLDDNAEAGHYFEVGVAPKTSLASRSRYPVTVALPVNAGFGDRQQYVGRRFGFVSAGVKVSAPLAFVSEPYGKWQVNGSAEIFYLGDTPAEFTNGGDHLTSLFSGSISAEF